MASTVSKIKKAQAEAEFYLLRAIHFRQKIPGMAFSLMSPEALSGLLNVLVGGGLVIRRGSRYILTDLGEIRLRALADGKPPLIDHYPGALKEPLSVDSFKVEASVAREISRRVSGGNDPSG